MNSNGLIFGIASSLRSSVLVRAISLVLAPVTSAVAAGVVLVLCLLSGAPLNAQGLNVDAHLFASYPPLTFGRKVSFRLTIVAPTGAPLSNVTAAINLPPGVNFMAASMGTPVVTGNAATGEQLTFALGSAPTEGDLVQFTVSVDNSVADGTTLKASFQMSGQASNSPFTVSGALQFQVGYLPVEIFVESYGADCGAGGISSNSGSSNNFFGGLGNVGRSSDGSSITAVAGDRLNGPFASEGSSGPNVSLPLVFDPFPAAIFQNKVGEITSANLSVRVTGLGNSADALGGYDTVIIQTGAGPVTQFFSAHSEVPGCQYSMSFFFRSPNPYRPELIVDDRITTYSAAGNEVATDPISGVIFGFPGSTGDPMGNGSGGGVATHTFFQRLLFTPTKSTLRAVESIACFPEVQSMCDANPPSDTTQTIRPTFNSIEYFTGLKAASAKAESNFAFNDDGTISLIRSGYGVVTGAQSITFLRGDANIGDFDASTPAQLVFTGNSPIGLLVTDAQRHRIGFNPPPNPPPAHVDARPTVVAEILGASYSGVNTHPQVIKLPDPKPGSYQVQVTGTGTGSFSLTMETLTVNGGLIDRETTSGNASPGSSDSFNLNVTADGRLSLGGAPPADTVPPTTVASATPAANEAGWNNTNVRVLLSATDNPGGSGVQEITFSASGAQTIASTTVSGASATIDITTEGQTTITFFAKDHAGNIESAKSLIVKLDKTPPTIIPSRAPAPNGNGWNNTNVTVSFACSDSLSGLAAGSPPAPMVLSTEGANQSVSGTCQDIAGNSASATVSGINIDKTPPTVTCSASPNVLWPPNHKLVPINASVTISDSLSGPAGFTLLSATSNEPDSGLGDIQGFTVGAASTSGQLRAERLGSGNGRVYTLTYSGTDRAGNSATCAATVMVPHDQGKP